MTTKNLPAIIQQLDYDFTQFDLDHFRDHVERRERREIIVRGAPISREISGMWVKAETAHYIFYSTHLHPIHQTHTILHELAHIILKHQPKPLDQVLSPALFQQLSGTNPLGLARDLTGIAEQDPDEVEAEQFVFLMQEKIMIANRMQELMGEGSSNQGLDRYVRGMVLDDQGQKHDT